VKVRFTTEAKLAAREKRDWWEQNREKAPRLFVDELADVVAKLRDGADQERQQYAARGGRVIYRLLMPKTKTHVYYRVNDTAQEVEVLLIWNAIAATGPDL
jgi:plasmid stabilization system protein ParE